MKGIAECDDNVSDEELSLIHEKCELDSSLQNKADEFVNLYPEQQLI